MSKFCNPKFEDYIIMQLLKNKYIPHKYLYNFIFDFFVW